MSILGTHGQPWFVVGALGSFLIAAVHVFIIVLGAPGYLYFGATSLALLAQQGSSAPAFITSDITLVFVVFGLYSLSGAQILPAFLLLRTVLIVVTSLYLVRGLSLIPDLIRLFRGAGYPMRETVFSAISLILGVLHVVGLRTSGLLSSRGARFV